MQIIPSHSVPRPDLDEVLPARVSAQAVGSLLLGIVGLCIVVAGLLLAAGGSWATNRLSRSFGRVSPNPRGTGVFH